MPPSYKNMGVIRAMRVKQEYEEKISKASKTWKPEDNAEEASTTYSEFSNAEFMNQIRTQEKTRTGKPRVPKYLKEDFPDHAMMPAKQLIQDMPSHVDRPPAEKFDELVIKVFKGINKRTKPKKQKGKCQSEIKQAEATQLQAKQREMQIRNFFDQQVADT